MSSVVPTSKIVEFLVVGAHTADVRHIEARIDTRLVSGRWGVYDIYTRHVIDVHHVHMTIASRMRVG